MKQLSKLVLGLALAAYAPDLSAQIYGNLTTTPLGYQNVTIGTTTSATGLLIQRPENSYTNRPSGVLLSGGYSGNAAIELRNKTGGTPYMDFSNGTNNDYDARVVLQNDNLLNLVGASFNVGYSTNQGSTKLAVNGGGFFKTTLGIGTSSPEGGLEVFNNDFVVGGTYKKFIFHTQHWMSNSSRLIIAPKNSGAWDFNKALVLHDDGRLDVNGKLYAAEVQVQLPPFPDYVFDADYERMSLGQLQTYIDKNHHLPGIPSAEEVEKEGIGMGELMTKQMEKIEELTLYILELKGEIDDLKGQLEESASNQK